MPQTIAVLSQKGGTGKTTAVRTLADAFRRSGVRTLVVDLDPQGNLSDYFGLLPDGGPTIADVLAGRAHAAEAIREDLISADLTLAETELILANKMGRELTLRRTLAEATGDYGLVLIDCPPSLGLLTVNALVAADQALITAEAQYFASRGVERSIEVVELARECLNPKLSLLGVLINMADMRTRHSRAAASALAQRLGALVFETVVRASIAYAESAKRSVSILDHRPDLGADYLALAGEVLERIPGWDVSTRALAALHSLDRTRPPVPEEIDRRELGGGDRPEPAPFGPHPVQTPHTPRENPIVPRDEVDELDRAGVAERLRAFGPADSEWAAELAIAGAHGVPTAAGRA
jgi:chromosome partitioning protein